MSSATAQPPAMRLRILANTKPPANAPADEDLRLLLGDQR